MNTDQTVTLVSALAIAAGLAYLAMEVGKLRSTADRVTTGGVVGALLG